MIHWHVRIDVSIAKYVSSIKVMKQNISKKDEEE